MDLKNPFSLSPSPCPPPPPPPPPPGVTQSLTRFRLETGGNLARLQWHRPIEKGRSLLY